MHAAWRHPQNHVGAGGLKRRSWIGPAGRQGQVHLLAVAGSRQKPEQVCSAPSSLPHPRVGPGDAHLGATAGPRGMGTAFGADAHAHLQGDRCEPVYYSID